MPLKTVEILLIEDNEGDILLTKKAFEKGSFNNHISVARNGREGLDFLYKVPPFQDAPTPHLILLDINMPEIDGHELLKAIKSDKKLRPIPVVILSTSNSNVDVKKAYELQASSYICKPVDFEEFANLIQQMQNYWVNLVEFPK